MNLSFKEVTCIFSICLLLACKGTEKKASPQAATPAQANRAELAGPIEQGQFTFLSLNQDGDENLLIVTRESDTLSMICNGVELPPLYRGDRISVQWNNKKYAPEGDPEAISVKPFVASVRVLRGGKLSKLLQEKQLAVQLLKKDSSLSDWAANEVREALLYYLSNTTDQTVRNAADVAAAQPIGFSMEKTEINSHETIEIRLFAANSDRPFKLVYYRFENKYDIWEYGALDPADGSTNRADLR